MAGETHCQVKYGDGSFCLSTGMCVHRITDLKIDNHRLREALEKIAQINSGYEIVRAIEVARTALGSSADGR